jgi:hypothetical protein
MKRTFIISALIVCLILSVAAFIRASSISPGTGTSGIAPWLTVTDPTLVSFSWRNQGSATVTNRTQSIWLFSPGSGGGENIHGREITAPGTPWSITVGFIMQQHNTTNNTDECGLYVTDGTKLIFEASFATSTGLAVSDYNSVTSFNANLTNPNNWNPPSPVFFKVVDDATNLAWYWSVNGQDFNTPATQTGLVGAFLGAITAVGFAANPSGSVATLPVGCLIISWKQGTS